MNAVINFQLKKWTRALDYVIRIYLNVNKNFGDNMIKSIQLEVNQNLLIFFSDIFIISLNLNLSKNADWSNWLIELIELTATLFINSNHSFFFWLLNSVILRESLNWTSLPDLYICNYNPICLNICNHIIPNRSSSIDLVMYSVCNLLLAFCPICLNLSSLSMNQLELVNPIGVTMIAFLVDRFPLFSGKHSSNQLIFSNKVQFII